MEEEKVWMRRKCGEGEEEKTCGGGEGLEENEMCRRLGGEDMWRRKRCGGDG